MTELLPQDRLRQIARVMALPVLPPGRLVPMLLWRVDTQAGRPVGRWVLSDEDGSPLTRWRNEAITASVSAAPGRQLVETSERILSEQDRGS